MPWVPGQLYVYYTSADYLSGQVCLFIRALYFATTNLKWDLNPDRPGLAPFMGLRTCPGDYCPGRQAQASATQPSYLSAIINQVNNTAPYLYLSLVALATWQRVQ